jgi:hypothetical protein
VSVRRAESFDDLVRNLIGPLLSLPLSLRNLLLPFFFLFRLRHFFFFFFWFCFAGQEPDGAGGWVEGVAIIVAVLIVAVVTATNDYTKEQQFRALSVIRDSLGPS